MLLIVALLLFVIFGGLGFVLHILWLGLIVAAIVAVFHFVTGGRSVPNPRSAGVQPCRKLHQ